MFGRIYGVYTCIMGVHRCMYGSKGVQRGYTGYTGYNMMDIHTKIALFTYPTPSLDVSHPIVFMYAFTFALDA